VNEAVHAAVMPERRNMDSNNFLRCRPPEKIEELLSMYSAASVDLRAVVGTRGCSTARCILNSRFATGEDRQNALMVLSNIPKSEITARGEYHNTELDARRLVIIATRDINMRCNKQHIELILQPSGVAGTAKDPQSESSRPRAVVTLANNIAPGHLFRWRLLRFAVHPCGLHFQSGETFLLAIFPYLFDDTFQRTTSATQRHAVLPSSDIVSLLTARRRMMHDSLLQADGCRNDHTHPHGGELLSF
jgi:hypothetical protein